jgi:hypothetical protein
MDKQDIIILPMSGNFGAGVAITYGLLMTYLIVT